MPLIKLKQVRGEHGWNGKLFEAGREYNVDDITANYLILHSKVAEEVNSNGVLQPMPSVISSGRLKVALVRIGGIGDALILALMATAVKRKYIGCHTTLFVRDKSCHEMIVSHPAVDRVVMVGNLVWTEFTKNLLTKDYDIIYDNRYITRVYYKNGKFDEEKKITDELFKPYEKLYNTFPMSANEIAKVAKTTEYEFSLKTANLKGSEDDRYVQLSRDDFNMVKLLNGQKYVTIHNGADVARQTKCWNTNRWKVVAKYLKEKGYTVIQLGMKYEEAIEDALDMTGRTTLMQCAGLIARASFHIDTEGGLVHIARGVSTRSIVLFGPTPISFFGYNCNINISADIQCKECWWTNDMWWRECPEKYPLPPKCMQAISAETVKKAIDEIEKMPSLQDRYDPTDINEKFAIDLTLTEGHYKSELHQWDRIQTMMSLVKGTKVLEIGAGDGYCVEVMQKQGKEVTATEVSKIRLKRMRDKGIEAVYADVNDLPFEDESFSDVICGEVLEHIDSIGKGFQELERVCKKDGKIIISIPVADEFRGIEMHKWGIRMHTILKQGKENMLVLEFERLTHGK